jgi:hypothetical protein
MHKPEVQAVFRHRKHLPKQQTFFPSLQFIFYVMYVIYSHAEDTPLQNT